jgi:signal transduction histidine kinase
VVLAAGFRGGLRPTLRVTAVGVAVYVSLILVTRPDGMAFYVMRPAYLTITGYLVGYLGEQRRRVEARLREVEAASQRERIARSLHDDYVQALAGVNVRLATCRELLRRGASGQALAELTELQAGVNREHDELRTYIRSLLDVGAATKPRVFEERTRFTVRAAFDGSLPVVEHVLQVMLEGARNVARHARASAAAIRVDAAGGKVVVAIDDDGVGFPPGGARPWSIASRAAELGGTVRVSGPDRPGGHVEIELRGA